MDDCDLMSRLTTIKYAATVLAALVLSACGGGGDPAPFTVPVTPAGVWKGSTDAGRDVTTIVLEDGTYYMVYGGATAGSVGGGVQGTGSLADSAFASATGRNYNLEGAGTQAATLAATLAPFDSLDGSVTSTTSGAMAFRTRYSADSIAPASLQTLAGDYPGQVTFGLGVRAGVFTITAAGQVSTVINGCSIGGTAAPRADVNAFDVTLVFGGAPCVFPGASFSGIAYQDAEAGTLLSFVRLQAAGQALFFSGKRS